MNSNITLQFLESIIHNDIMKLHEARRTMSSVNKSIFSEKTSFFSFRQQKGRKISLFSEIRVSRKGQMFLKYRNRQWRSAIWPSIFIFNRKFPFITVFLFLFYLTKRWKIPHHMVLAVVILGIFQCITRAVWWYIPF